MKVLMFGWEFPPHISGGLGTACYGLTKGLSHIRDLDVLFVVPKIHGDEDQKKMKLIGASDVSILKRELNIKNFQKTIECLEVDSCLVPYVDPEDFKKQMSYTVEGTGTFLKTDDQGKIAFSGKYGTNLITEIANYSMVAGLIAEDNRFDVIHAHDWLTYQAGIVAKEVSGKPLVIHVHATDFDRSGGEANPVVFDIEKKGMEAADSIITVSNLTRNIVIEKYGIDPEKVSTVYNAVEPVDQQEEPIKKGFDEKIVTFLGRITMQKGPEYFIKAASQVAERMDNVRFVMAGSGDMMHEMVDQVAAMGLTNKFHFTGFLKGKDVFDMLQMSDVYIMPSVSEPFGISPLEAMQSNVPVIISHQSGCAEMLKYALKVDYWNIDAMADAIHSLVKHPVMSKSLMENGKKEVDNIRWESSAKEVYKIYKKAVPAS